MGEVLVGGGYVNRRNTFLSDYKERNLSYYHSNLKMNDSKKWRDVHRSSRLYFSHNRDLGDLKGRLIHFVSDSLRQLRQSCYLDYILYRK